MLKCSLTEAQTRIWLDIKLRPAPGKYNLPVILELNKNFNLNIFSKIWNTLVNKHEALRTFIVEESAVPYQVISNQSDSCITHVNINNNNEKQAEKLIDDFISYNFTLSEKFLYKILAIHMEDRKYVVFLFHHIIIDGNSIEILLQEISLLYQNAVLQPKSISTTPLPSIKQYINFEHSQNNSMHKSGAINFWNSYLENASLSLNISDKISPQDHEVRLRQYFTLPSEIVQSMHYYIKENEGTIFTVMCTIFMSILYKYSKINDITITYPCNIKPEEYNSNIGFFVNNLPLRLVINESTTFDEAFLKIKNHRLESRTFQEYSLTKIIEIFRQNHTASPDIINMAISQSNFGLSGFNIENIECKTILPKIGSSGEDLTLLYQEHSGKIICALEYRTDLFSKSFITQMTASITVFTQNILKASNKNISFIPCVKWKTLDAAKQCTKAILYNPNDQQCIHRVLEKQLPIHAHKTAIAFQNTNITYNELNNQANKIAHFLINISPGGRKVVGIALNRSAHTIISILAILKSGNAYLPIDIKSPKKRLLSVVQDAKLQFLITEDSVLSLHGNLGIPFIINLNSFEEFSNTHNTTNISANDQLINSLAYIIYTSGSTGKPKGVAIKHSSLVNYINWANKYYPYSNNSMGTILHSSVAYDMSITSIFLPLIRGQTILILEENSNLLSYVSNNDQREEFCFIKLTPSHLKIMNLQQNVFLHCNSLIIGGEDLHYNVLKSSKIYARNIFNEYGPTETTVAVTIYNCNKEQTEGKVPIGKAIDNANIYILDEAQQPVPQGAIGEIYVGGLVLAAGYLNNLNMTKNRFVQNPLFPKRQELFYKTGDLAKCLSDGNILYVGRVDTQVKVSGHRVELEDVNSSIKKLKMVKNAISILHENNIISYIIQEKKITNKVNLKLAKSHIKNWNTVYKNTYKTDQNESVDDFAGWTNTSNMKQIPTQEMEEWVTETTKRILSLQPLHVLEIGCGTGLILKKIAPHCVSYTATDFSKGAIDTIQSLKLHNKSLNHVKIMYGEAMDVFCRIKDQKYDLIILNSVIQYFPSIQYLESIIQQALKVIETNGKIFIGDIRHHRLLDMHYAAIYKNRNIKQKESISLDQFIQQCSHYEDELVIDPMYFYQLMKKIHKITHVKAQLKYGIHNNELNKFRYDITLFSNTTKNPNNGKIRWYDWKKHHVHYEKIKRILDEYDVIGIKNIPNERLEQERRLICSTRNMDYKETKAINPNDFNIFTLQNHLYLETNWINNNDNGEYDIVISKHPIDTLTNISFYQKQNLPSTKPLFNNPLQKEEEYMLAKKLIASLSKTLPQYMIPSNIVFIDELPLNQNGKLEIANLPKPLKQNYAKYKPERMTNYEKELYKIYVRLLNTKNINKDDNFFFLGGSSLLLIKLLNMIRKNFSIDIPLQQLFLNPTIRNLGSLIPKLKTQNNSTNFPIMRQLTNRHNANPLSHNQKRLWFLNHFLPNGAIYNMFIPLRVDGRLSNTLIKRTLTTLLQRHEAFRTGILTDKSGEGIQIINDNTEIPIENVDARFLSKKDIYSLIVKKINLPFCINIPPLIRSYVFHLSYDKTILLFVMHHIISDGQSQDIFLKEFEVIYNAYSSNNKVCLPNINYQYIDFTVWHNNVIKHNKNISKQLEYWENQLVNLPDILFSNTDYPRPVKLSYQGNISSITIPSDINDKLKTLSKENNTSMFNISLAIFALAINFFTNKNDIVIGTPVSNRHYPNVEHIIGFFANTLPIRLIIEKNITFQHLLDYTKEKRDEALINQDIPFDQLVNLVKHRGSLNVNPIFQIEAVYQEFPDNKFKLDKFNTEILNIHNYISRFDMVFITRSCTQKMEYIVEYSEDLFAESTIQALLHSIKLITLNAVRNTSISINKLKKLVGKNEQS